MSDEMLAELGRRGFDRAVPAPSGVKTQDEAYHGAEAPGLADNLPPGKVEAFTQYCYASSTLSLRPKASAARSKS